jgi:archaellum component FlaD/FlaE
MELNDKVTQLEDEIKILKNEVQAVLLDLRESCLKYENPFNPDRSSMTGQPAFSTVEPQIAIEQLEATEEEPEDMPMKAEPENEPFAQENPENLPINENKDNELPLPGIPSGEAEPVFKPGSNGSDETALEEVIGARRPETEVTPQFKAREATAADKEKLDLAAIDGLAQWVDETVNRLGHERTRTILDITEKMGYLNTDLKNILVRFIHPVPDGHETSIATQDYLSSLLELNDLLGTGNKTEVALLYILCQENEK